MCVCVCVCVRVRVMWTYLKQCGHDDDDNNIHLS